MNDIAIIALTRGLKALVDAEDFEYLSQFKWHANWQGNDFYAARTKEKILMHRIIIKATGKQIVDHINRNTLDNRKTNLRVVTNSENCLNRLKRGGVSYRGDSFLFPWRVRVRIGEYKRKHLGVFRTREEAQEALDAYTNS